MLLKDSQKHGPEPQHQQQFPSGLQGVTPITMPCKDKRSTDSQSRDEHRALTLDQAGKKHQLNKETGPTIKTKCCFWGAWNDPRYYPSAQKGELGQR